MDGFAVGTLGIFRIVSGQPVCQFGSHDLCNFGSGQGRGCGNDGRDAQGSTNSIGSDNNRKIVIYLTDKRPKGIFEEDAQETVEVAEVIEAIETVDADNE